tara:strand:- start:787 stop:954 length:168 start_codon:yes stop_codon:yes gene_type:complete
MLEKRADFKVGKSFNDDGSGKKATRAPKTINELLNDTKLPGNKSKEKGTDVPEDA